MSQCSQVGALWWRCAQPPVIRSPIRQQPPFNCGIEQDNLRDFICLSQAVTTLVLLFRAVSEDFVLQPRTMQSSANADAAGRKSE